MCRFFMIILVMGIFISCSKNEEPPSTPVVIPDIIYGVISEFKVTPVDINTPDKGTFLIYANNTSYKVDFNAVDESESNAILLFDSDTILTDQSREIGNVGTGAVAYSPVGDNLILMLLDDGKKINGLFNAATSFGGVFGEDLISQWRDPGDPAKPTQKAKDDITNLVQRYSDQDGPGPATSPQYLSVTITKR